MESGELGLLAKDIIARLRDIVGGAVKPDDPQLQNWATQQYARLDAITASDSTLLDAVEDNLVNILTCDGAAWDTTPGEFTLALARLERLTADG